MILIREFKPNLEKKNQFRKALLITIIGNVLLASIKGVAAYMSSSAALYSDAINSISDVVYSVFLVIGLTISQKPPDADHPQGHERFEPLIGLIITISMTIAGFEALRSSITRFFSNEYQIPLGITSIALLASAALKTGMYFVIRKIAKIILSPGLDAAAKDNLSDILTSAAAFIGILGAQFLHPFFDPAAGILVALWIFKAAFEVGRENLNFLMGGAADEDLRSQILEKALSIPGVLGVHQLVTEYVGPKVVVDMHIDVEESIQFREAHAISDRVADAIQSLPEIDRAYIHPEPTRAETQKT